MNLSDQKRWRTTVSEDGDREIVGKYGTICQYEDGDLDVWVTNKRVACRLEKCWTAEQHYDDAALFIRPYSDLNYAAKIIRARKRRHMSPEQKKKAVEKIVRFQFPGRGHADKGVEND